MFALFYVFIYTYYSLLLIYLIILYYVVNLVNY